MPPPANTVAPARSDQPRAVGAYYPPVAPLAEAATTSDRFKLVGVVGPRPSVPGSQWVAFIAVDDQPARAFIVGAPVKGDTVLKDVSARGAILGPRVGSVAMALELSPAPATGEATAPTRAGLESQDSQPNRGSKFMILPPPAPVVPENPANKSSEPDDGRWRPPSPR